jgi:RHS repeat-associated protein
VRGTHPTLADPLENMVQYRYNADGLLTQRIDARGHVVETIAYDNFQPPRVAWFVEKGETFTVAYFSNRTEKRDSHGNTWTYYYNDVGIIKRTVDPLGNEVKQGLNKLTATSVDWEENGNGNRTSYTYDVLGNATNRTDALGNTWAYTYVAGTDRVETETNPLRVITKYEYDANGNQTKSIRDFGGSLENTTAFTYDTQGNQTSITDAMGNTTLYQYDVQGNVIKMIDPIGNVTTSTYDGRGNRLTETNANGHTTTLAYDLMDRLVSTTDAKGNTTNFQYDANGNRIAAIDAQDNTRMQGYDAYNRLTQVIDALGNTTVHVYDSRDNIVSTKDANGNTTAAYTYDIMNRLLRGTNALGEQTNFAYDAVGNLLTITDGNGNTTAFAYDALNRVVTENYPDGAQRNYTYDTVGNRISGTDPNGNATRFSYDNLNRLLTKTDADGTTANFTYDALGHMLTGNDSDSRLAYTYDANGRVTLVNQNSKTISYSYDGIGNRTSMTTPKGEVVQYSYDDINLMTGVQFTNGKGVSYTYDSLHRLTRKDYTGGGHSTYNYNEADRLTQIESLNKDSTLIDFQTNGFDKVGNLLAKTTSLGTTNYTYDQTDRLTDADHSTKPNETFIYDAVGNRLSSTAHNDWTYNNRNELVSYDGISYTYDANGNTLTKIDASGLARYTYDYDNRLIRVDFPEGSYANYKYDVFGKRVEKDVNGTVTRYVYDGNVPLAEYDGFGTLQRTYIHGATDTNPSFWQDANGVFFFHHDHLSTPTLVTAVDGTVVWQATFDTFGQASMSTETVENNFRFPGQYFDSETGLHYNWHRYYSPETGRYITSDPLGELSDPLGEQGGMNLYVYSSNNPLLFIDYTGLVCGVKIYRQTKKYENGRINVGHEWIEYSSGSMGFGSMGFWPTSSIFLSKGVVYRPDLKVYDEGDKLSWDTKRISSWFWAKLEYGKGKGTKCKCATCEDIIDCMEKVADHWDAHKYYTVFGQNCRHFVVTATSRCCLVY